MAWKALESFTIETWQGSIEQDIKDRAAASLEGGRVLFFPKLSFSLKPEEAKFLSPEKIDPKSKNISYDIRSDKIAGTLYDGAEAEKLKAMLKRFALLTRQFLNSLIPHYDKHLIQAKTSFRPVEIAGRKSSYRKDDTLLHVDSFPSNPTKGQRILRVFANINPNGKPRVWRIGEPFEIVARKFVPHVSRPFYGVSQFLKWLGITKDYRTLYDHYMLNIHDAMKGDARYQRSVSQEEIHFPAGSSWMVFTDQVSHAAMSGQHVLEQTFHLPIEGLHNEATAPVRVLESLAHRKLL